VISNAAALSPPRKPYNAENDPELKVILAKFKVVHRATDEVVDKVMNKATEKVLNTI
jgi:hypothetical protein